MSEVMTGAKAKQSMERFWEKAIRVPEQEPSAHFVSYKLYAATMKACGLPIYPRSELIDGKSQNGFVAHITPRLFNK